MNSHKLEHLFFIVYGLRSTEQGSKQICLDPDSDSAYRTWSEQSEMMFLCVCVGDAGPSKNYPMLLRNFELSCLNTYFQQIRRETVGHSGSEHVTEAPLPPGDWIIS